ncbi:MAG: metallophosphoesterase [Tumebacillaceae bacterium]
MKLLSFSDLHVDNTNQILGGNITREIAAYIREVNPNRVIVAGDMAGGAERCIRYIEEIEQQSGVPLSYVPGNHSIWTLNKQSDSWEEYHRLRDHHSSLIDRPLQLNDEWVLIGDMGWYDYTLGDPTMTRQQIVSKKEMVWKDSVLARWGMEDEELTDLMVDKFHRQLEAHRDKNVIFVNHFIPYQYYAPISMHNRIWNTIRPFMGSSKIGTLLDSHEQVKYVIFGHVHWRYGPSEFHGKKVICQPLGYVSEWRSANKDVVTEIRNSATLIEI